MTQIEVSAWLAAGYAVVLVLVAYGIDALARRAQLTLTDHHAPGFTYHEDHDAWLCPQDQWLWPQSFDPDNRVMRYRGSPSVCNHCPVKDSCTTSDDGREMRRMVDTWPASESARFHRGIACAVTVLAMVWPLATAFTVNQWSSQVLVLGVAVAAALASLPLWSHLRHTPADPHGVLVKSLDENLEDRAAAAAALARRATTYASDRRSEAGRA
ncbi:MAG: hypothetical protein GXY39_14085 [Actinomycetales bacterium]|nr:hypothetical protein [Actinomycetales bacterium]